jgi:hypothetical protein
MQILALISIYAPVVITVIAVNRGPVFVLLGVRAAAACDGTAAVSVAGTASAGAVEICRSSRALSLHEMDINKMLAELRAEREQVDEAIIVLERLARGQGRRRGRPPAWMTTVKRRGRPPGSKNKSKSTDV